MLGTYIKKFYFQDYREYLQTKFPVFLEAGKKYYGGFYISLAENYKRYSTNNLGMYFSNSNYLVGDSTYWGINTGTINVIPQIFSDTTINLNDTLNWVLVADTFIAQGGEQYVTIGNFRIDSLSVIVPTGYNCSVNDSATYYFIEDVFLYCLDPVCQLIPPTASFDCQPKCKNQNIQLTDKSIGGIVSWSWSMPGGTPSTSTAQNPIVSYALPGKYLVSLTVIDTQALASTVFTDTVYVLPDPPLYCADRVICLGLPVTLMASGATTYTWSTGATTANISVTPTTTTPYTVTATDYWGCTISKTVTVTVLNGGPLFNVSNNILCDNGVNISLSATPTNGTFSGAGVVGTVFQPSTVVPGNYVLTYTYPGPLTNCVGTDTANVTVINCATALTELNFENKILVFPNPAENNLQIKFAKEIGVYEISFFNLIGENIFLENIIVDADEFIYNIALNNIESGVYFLELKSNNKKLLMKKIVVQH